MTENNAVAEVEQYEPAYQDVTEPTTPALRRLEAEALAMDKAHKLARGLSATMMVPEHFQQQKKGEQAIWDLAAAILYGAELGLSAPQSAQNVFVVKGKPAVYARTMAAQVLRAGYVLHEVEASDARVVWEGTRDGRTSSAEWTIERAQQAGYTANDRYRTNPTEMLRAKCIAEVCRIMFPDVLLGMAYTVEELQLENVTVQRVVRQGSRGTAKLREIAEQRQEAPATPEPATVEAEVVTPAAEPAAVVPASNPQQAEIRKLYKARGVTGQPILDELSVYFERTISRLSDLSFDDAQAVITTLSKAPENESTPPENENGTQGQ